MRFGSYNRCAHSSCGGRLDIFDWFGFHLGWPTLKQVCNLWNLWANIYICWSIHFPCFSLWFNQFNRNYLEFEIKREEKTVFLLSFVLSKIKIFSNLNRFKFLSMENCESSVNFLAFVFEWILPFIWNGLHLCISTRCIRIEMHNWKVKVSPNQNGFGRKKARRPLIKFEETNENCNWSMHPTNNSNGTTTKLTNYN